MMIRMRIPRLDANTICRNIVFTLIALLSLVIVYAFFSIRTSFDRMADALHSIFP